MTEAQRAEYAKCVVYDPNPASCWGWTGRRDARLRPLLSIEGSRKNGVSARPVAWEIAHGAPPPAGAKLHMTCHNVACTRVDHMRAKTSHKDVRHGARTK